jgi:hypothetical protein
LPIVQLEQKRIETLTPKDLEIELQEDVSDNFVWQAMMNSFDPLTNTVKDLSVDDRDLKRAKNYFDFCKNIAGKTIKLPFARQLWISYVLFGEYCPHCTDKHYYTDVTNIPVDMDPNDLVKKVVLLEDGVCPKCSRTKSGMILDDSLVGYNQLVLVAGQRGGKSSFSSTKSAYHAHALLKSPRLAAICQGIQEFTPLTSTFVALTVARANKLLWSPFYQIIDNSDWFKEYFRLLDDVGRRYDKELYKKNDTFFRFFHRNLDYYFMGPNMRTLRGDTRVLAVTDELGMFPFDIKRTFVDNEGEEQELDDEDNERERANADEVHQSLDNSLSTVRTEMYDLYKRGINTIPTGLNIAISSPKSWQDKICRLLGESANPDALSLGLRLPTWEINPLYTRSHPIIRQAYARNATKAERDFGANPPRVDSAVFNRSQVQHCFVGRQYHKLKVDLENPEYTVAKLTDIIEKAEWSPHAMAVDAGLVNNSFALALGRRKDLAVEVCTVLELMPSSKRPIHFPSVYRDILLPLAKNCNVCAFGADRWNSIGMLQQIKEDTNDRCMPLSVTLNSKQFDYFKDLVQSGSLILPSTELKFDNIEEVKNYKTELVGYPVDHLYLQMMTTVDENGSLQKGSGFTDDILRSVIVLTAMLFMPKVREHMEKQGTKSRDITSNKARVFVSGRSRFPLR